MAMIGLVPGAGSGGGLGMAAAALARAGRPARVTEALYCPPAVRDDPRLAAVVQDRVDAWAVGVGLAPGPVAGLGRLVVLAHPDTGDAGRLEVAARLVAVGRVLAGGGLGAGVEDVVRRAPDAGAGAEGEGAFEAVAARLAQSLDDAVAEVYDGCDIPDAALPANAEPVGAASAASAGWAGGAARAAGATPARAGVAQAALMSAMAGLSALPASPYQVQRVRRECEALAAAGLAGGGPRAPWEYLSMGHVNAYSPALAALDAVGGFEMSPSASADPELRRAQRLAALAAALLHDIACPQPSGLTAAIARSDGLGPGAAGRRAAGIHDEAMRAFQHHAAQLAGCADGATRRYLAALWTWLGGHRSWHAVS